ncbi:MAG: phosphate signaling complex protein PhoU [Planctomycetes bacterium]|nr:phosphate signaling complex protein PhoU [Planctomycetota bacterium]
MTKHFHRDLEKLHGNILSLSAMVEEMIDLAGRALCDTDLQSLVDLAEMDRQVDQREVAVEEECLKMLALHQPVAIDLRRIATVLKINNDLERIGDLACSIAERSRGLRERPDFPLPAKLERMVALASGMVRDALNAFVDFDATAARAVCRRDESVDQINREIIGELVRLMEQRPVMVAPAMHCFSATRQVERIADHATNIAEDVVYLVEGEIVRHHRSSSFAVA